MGYWPYLWVHVNYKLTVLDTSKPVNPNNNPNNPRNPDNPDNTKSMYKHVCDRLEIHQLILCRTGANRAIETIEQPSLTGAIRGLLEISVNIVYAFLDSFKLVYMYVYIYRYIWF